MKRAPDVAVSGLLLLLASPVLLVACLATRLETPGSPIYVQERVGRHGRPFRMYKIRSMFSGSDAKGPHHTDPGDPRVTRVGRFLRRTSLDELPQLFNVLRGDMSLVGPRPDVPRQRELYTEEEWSLRHRVRPGVTGLAQATLRSDATPDQRKALDLEYARRPTMTTDLRVMVLTIRQVLGRGGY